MAVADWLEYQSPAKKCAWIAANTNLAASPRRNPGEYRQPKAFIRGTLVLDGFLPQRTPQLTKPQGRDSTGARGTGHKKKRAP